jgi:hypothetical protein
MTPSKAMGPSTLQGSKGAKQALVAILEALSGEVSTSDVAERLTISLSRYYQLETRALQGMLAALEPRPRGRRRGVDEKLGALMAEKKELERELRRQRSLLRAAQRSVGLPVGRGGKKKAKRKLRDRGATVRQTLRAQVEEGGVDGQAERSGAVGGPNEGERAGS